MNSRNTAKPLTNGVLLALVSAAAFGTAGSLGASLLDTGWSPGAAVATRVLLGALVLTVPALRNLRALGGGRLGALRRSWRSIVAFGLLGVAGAQFAYFSAVQTLSVAVALLLEYSAVFLVAGWLWLRQGERPRPTTVLGGGVAAIGLVLVLQVLGGVTVDPVGVLWGLGAAVGLAGYFVVSARTEEALPPLVLAWGGLIVGGGVLLVAGLTGLLPLTIATSDVVLLDRQVSWIVPVLALGVIAAALAYGAGVLAARVLGATVASFVGLTEVLFAMLFALLLLGQSLSGTQLIGAVLVVVGIVAVQAGQVQREAPASAAVSGS